MPERPAIAVPGSDDLPPLRNTAHVVIDDAMRSQGDELALRHAIAELTDLFWVFAERYPAGRGAEFVAEAGIRRPGQQ